MQDFLDELEGCIPALRRYARSLTRDNDQADDLVQDCMERAIRKQRLWSPTGPLRSWLFKILLNLYRNSTRTKRRRGDHTTIDDLTVEPSVAASQPGRIALNEMWRAIDELPADQRTALLLVTVQGASYAEAAEILEIPAGTLMSRLGRARAAVKAMTGYSDEPPRLRTVK